MTTHPTEPVEIGVQTWGVHNVTETLEVDVLIDAGADGVFADEELQADFLAVKLAAPGGEVCVFALPSHLRGCDALYFADYSNYNSNLVGLVLDAADDRSGRRRVRLRVQRRGVHRDVLRRVPGLVCDSAGAIDDDSGTWDLVFDAADPALAIDPLVCKGFWDGRLRRSRLRSTSASAPQMRGRPSILALFPNDRPHRTAAVVETTT